MRLLLWRRAARRAMADNAVSPSTKCLSPWILKRLIHCDGDEWPATGYRRPATGDQRPTTGSPVAGLLSAFDSTSTTTSGAVHAGTQTSCAARTARAYTPRPALAHAGRRHFIRTRGVRLHTDGDTNSDGIVPPSSASTVACHWRQFDWVTDTPRAGSVIPTETWRHHTATPASTA